MVPFENPIAWISERLFIFAKTWRVVPESKEKGSMDIDFHVFPKRESVGLFPGKVWFVSIKKLSISWTTYAKSKAPFGLTSLNQNFKTEALNPVKFFIFGSVLSHWNKKHCLQCILRH